MSHLKILSTDIYFLLIVVLSVSLFVFKFPYFDLPYFSDELWVYGPSFRKMGENFPSLIPTSLNVDEHWGHPLMFFFIGSFWCLIFGSSIVSTHVFSAMVSTLLLWVIYVVIKRIFNRQLAFYTTLVFVFQSIFLGQYNLVLPEVMLTLFMFITLYAYINHKTFLYIISGACLVLIKETGVLLIGTIILWHIIRSIVYEKNYKISFNALKLYVVLASPFLFITAHILLLKYFYGWYIVPERIEHFEFTWEVYYDRIRDAFYYVFISQGRKPLTLTLFVALILFNNKIKLWQRLLLFVFVFSLVKVFFNYWKLPTIFPMVIVPILVLVLTKYLLWDKYKENKEQGAFIAILTLFTFIYILFSASQFDSLRYLLCIVPMIIFIVLFIVWKQIGFFKRLLLPIISFLVVISSLVYIANDNKFGDDTLNYKDVCIVNKQAVEYLENQKYFDRTIISSFLFKYQLIDYRAGYLTSSEIFKKVNTYEEKNKSITKDIYIFSNTDLPEIYNQVKKSDQYILDKKLQKGLIWIEIYKVNT